MTAELFDRIPIDWITEAEHAVQEAAANIPAELAARFNSASALSDEDRATIVRAASDALIRFLSSSESNLKREIDSQSKPTPEKKL